MRSWKLMNRSRLQPRIDLKKLLRKQKFDSKPEFQTENVAKKERIKFETKTNGNFIVQKEHVLEVKNSRKNLQNLVNFSRDKQKYVFELPQENEIKYRIFKKYLSQLKTKNEEKTHERQTKKHLYKTSFGYNLQKSRRNPSCFTQNKHKNKDEKTTTEKNDKKQSAFWFYRPFNNLPKLVTKYSKNNSSTNNVIN